MFHLEYERKSTIELDAVYMACDSDGFWECGKSSFRFEIFHDIWILEDVSTIMDNSVIFNRDPSPKRKRTADFRKGNLYL